MENKKSITAVERIFEEAETIKYSENELDRALKNIHIDPDKLVTVGLEKIRKLLDQTATKEIPLPTQFPIAATKQKTDLDRLKKDVVKEDTKHSKPKKK